mgnify:CR=1 FL=1
MLNAPKPDETFRPEHELHNVTLIQFRDECARFRRIMTDKNNSLYYMEQAFGYLFLVSCRLSPALTPEEKETADAWFRVNAMEWPIRQGMMAMAGHPLYKNEAEKNRAEAWMERPLA